MQVSKETEWNGQTREWSKSCSAVFNNPHEKAENPFEMLFADITHLYSLYIND